MTQPDWHSADTLAALKKRGTSLAGLSRHAGKCALLPLAQSEKLTADALGVTPEQIWPSRYR